MEKGEQKNNPIMRAEEVCKELGIGKNTFYEWCRLNLIPYKRVGRLIFVSRNKNEEVNNEGNSNDKR
jgi:excisionase family DNA binding protein